MKILNLRGLTAVGIAALILAFAGNARATPFALPDVLDSGVHWGTQHNYPSDSGAARSHHHNIRHEQFVSLFASFLLWLDMNKTAAETLPSCSVVTPVAVVQTAPSPIATVATPTNVPDGGATVLMLGVAMIGLVFIRKRERTV